MVQAQMNPLQKDNTMSASNTGIRNLYQNSNGYYVYKRPDNGKRFGMGKDRYEAIAAAKELNERLMTSTSRVEKVIGEKTDSITFEQHTQFVIEAVWEQRLLLAPGMKDKMSQSTVDNYKQLVKVLNREMGDKPLNDAIFTVKFVSSFLEKQTPNMSQMYRRVLSVLFNKAISRGHMKTNPAQMSDKAVIAVARKRLSFELFLAIREEVPPWVQNAMDLDIHLANRVSDISGLRWRNNLLIENGNTYLQYIASKTKNNKKLVGHRVKCEGPLLEVIKRCRDDVVSEFILHFPRREREFERFTGKPLSTQYLSKSFKLARNRVLASKPELFVTEDESRPGEGIMRPMKPGEYPSWHEIRSLAGWLVDQANKDDGKSAQKLFGHKSSAMTALYLSRRPLEWIEITAGSNVNI
jgi:integrase